MASTYRYKPAHTMADLSAPALAAGHQSMAEFLLSPQLMKPVLKAAADIADDARAIIVAEAYDTGALLESVNSGPAEPMVFNGNPRVAAAVTMHGGIYRRAKDPESSVGAVVEFGNSQTRGKGPAQQVRPLWRAGQPYHSPKGPL